MMIDAPSYSPTKKNKGQKGTQPDEDKGVELTEDVARDILRKIGANK